MAVDLSAQHTWEAVLGRLQLQVPRPTFETWLRDTKGILFEDGTLVVSVPTPFAAEWLERRMYALIEESVATITQTTCHISFQVNGMPLAVSNPRPAPDTTSILPRIDKGLRLNPRYSFSSFIVGDNNQLAYAAARAVADHPGRSYNPLFIYGAVGLGKTHLLQAIGQSALEQGHSVSAVTCEEFTNAFLTAIRTRQTDAFRAKYRQTDFLLIDDIQFLAGKESTQEGFFHTFNFLYNANRQIVLTCDRHPSALPLLEERLRSRFESGLLADITLPSLETRTALLSSFAETASVSVPNEVLDFLASYTPGNVRQLEGSLNRVAAIAQFTNVPVTISLAQQALGASIIEPSDKNTPRGTIAAVAAHYHLPPATLLSGRRDRPVAKARQLAMYVLHQYLHLSPESIGAALGGRDRTTVIYNIKQVSTKLDNDATFQTETQQLLATFK